MPVHWYFTSALPRALLGGYPLAAVGCLMEPRVRPFVLLVTAYIVMYSFLPHKEVLHITALSGILCLAVSGCKINSLCRGKWTLDASNHMASHQHTKA